MGRIFGGAVLLAVLTVGLGAWAQTPMTPSRPNPPAASTSWVEPPASAKPPAAPATAAAPAIAAADLIPATKAERQAASAAAQRPTRRSVHRTRPSGDSMAARLNRQELNSIRSGSSRYYRGYWSWSGY